MLKRIEVFFFLSVVVHLGFLFGFVHGVAMGDRDRVEKPLTAKDVWSPRLERAESSRPLEIRFNEPAKHWTDAFPIGNGRLGAMVWGGVATETLNLNGKFTYAYTIPQNARLVRSIRRVSWDWWILWNQEVLEVGL